MTVRPVLWIDGVEVSAAELRAGLLGLLAAGPGPLQVSGGVRYTDGSDLQVARGSSGFGVRVQPGACLVPGTETTTQAGYGLWNDAPLSVALAAASSANPRTDRIVARVVDTGDATSTYTIEPVTGDSSAPGAPVPAMPANALELAQVYVPAGATLAQLVVTDRRSWLRMTGPPDSPAWSNVTLSGGAADGGNGQSLHRARLIPSTGQVELQFDVDTTRVSGSGAILGKVPDFARPTGSPLRYRVTTPASSQVLNTHLDVRPDGTLYLSTQNPSALTWLALNVVYTP